MSDSADILFLYGNDEFAISRRLKAIQAELDDEPNADLNISRLDGRALSADALHTALHAAPFLASRRLVILANPSAAYTTPQARKRFLALLENLPPTTQLVMHEYVETRIYRDPRRQAREDERHWIVRWAGKKEGVALERYPLPPLAEMPQWVVREAQRQGGEIDPDAAAHLAEMVGRDTRQAAQEIAKLLAYVNWERTITARDVEAVSVLTAQESVFDLVDALALGDGRRAQAVLHRLLEEEDPFRLFGMIVRQFRLLILAREVIASRGTVDDALQAMPGLHPYVVKKAYHQAQRFPMHTLEAIYHYLLKVDLRAKTGQMPLETALDVLTAELTPAKA